jgi:undecaprenyl-diphosphatase
MTEWLIATDRSLFLLFNSFHSIWLDPIMVTLSGQMIWIPLVGYFLYRAYSLHGLKVFMLFGLFLFLTLTATDVTSSYIIKNIFNRLRPCRELDLKPLIYSFGQKCGGKFGFVSSHSANSFALIFFSLRTLTPRRAHFIIWLVPFLVSYSRVYLGVHYPGDILGGIWVGLIIAYIFSELFKSATAQA